MNISHYPGGNLSFCLVDHCWIRIEEEIDPQVLKWFDVLYGIVTLLLLFVGLPVNLAVIHYERFGGDSQKRSLNNRFTSYAVVFGMIETINLQVFLGFVR